jgi:hypothetical protein
MSFVDTIINDYLTTRPLKRVENAQEKDLATIAKTVRESQEDSLAREKPSQIDETAKRTPMVCKYVGATLENVGPKSATLAPKRASPVTDLGISEKKTEKQAIDDTARTTALMKLTRKVSEKYNNLIWFSKAMRQHFIDLVTLVSPPSV